jgi:hypothetical protein
MGQSSSSAVQPTTRIDNILHLVVGKQYVLSSTRSNVGLSTEGIHVKLINIHRVMDEDESVFFDICLNDIALCSFMKVNDNREILTFTSRQLMNDITIHELLE